MDRIQQLDAIIAQFDLNNHPFYQEWRMGTLPTEKLASYAAEYGGFVATVDKAWDTLGETDYAAEERFHDELWQDFRKELGAGKEICNAETRNLVQASESLFGNPGTAAGALYAFEAQQPHTSSTKLDGLNEHYSFSEKGKEYFRIHADDLAEAENLRERFLNMTDAEFERNRVACAVLASSLWCALDGVYYN